ncbi:AIR carboxylase family protein, partial [bacterium]|nr:AIR carboxylase family protein [bacterium]
AEKKGLRVIIAGAGGAAHLAGVLASRTILPVIAVPLNSPLRGLDSFYSTLQMPSGVPVATMGIGKAGARNAAILAVEILAIKYPGLRRKLKEYKRQLAQKVGEKDRRWKPKS